VEKFNEKIQPLREQLRAGASAETVRPGFEQFRAWWREQFDECAEWVPSEYTIQNPEIKRR